MFIYDYITYIKFRKVCIMHEFDLCNFFLDIGEDNFTTYYRDYFNYFMLDNNFFIIILWYDNEYNNIILNSIIMYILVLSRRNKKRK